MRRKSHGAYLACSNEGSTASISGCVSYLFTTGQVPHNASIPLSERTVGATLTQKGHARCSYEIPTEAQKGECGRSESRIVAGERDADRQSVVGTLIGTTVSAAAAAFAIAGHGLTSPRPSGPITAFGGPVAVSVPRVGHIEIDLEGSAAATALRRIRCAGGPAGSRCFVGG